MLNYELGRSFFGILELPVTVKRLFLKKRGELINQTPFFLIHNYSSERTTRHREVRLKRSFTKVMLNYK